MEKHYTEQQINDIFFNLQKWECPVKFIYINPEWANAWETIETQSKSYQDGEILEKSITTYLNELWGAKEIAIFDFWCGIGNNIKQALLFLTQNNYTIHYHAFDISQEIIKKCTQNLINTIPNLSIDATIIDFETTNLIPIMFDIRKKYNNIPVLWLFLGNTVWNFSSMERVISNIMDSLRLEDRLVIWLQRVELNNKRRLENTIKYYEKNIIQEILFSVLKYLWIKNNQGNYYVEFDYKTNSIECYFEFNIQTILQYDTLEAKFEPWERVRIGKSTKRDESNFTKTLLDLNLRIASLNTSYDNNYLQVLVSNKRK